MLIGGLEAGGTKMVCVSGDEFGNIFNKVIIPTESPEITMPKMIDFFVQEKVGALGIGSFGPIDLNKKSPTYGTILNTPKVLWRSVDIVKQFRHELRVPIGVDTDVNAAALGEALLGAGKGKEHVVYITIGTGIGVGVCINKELVHGLMHPEGGHIRIEKRFDDPLEGVCPFHANCAESLASGPAQNKRLEMMDKEDKVELAWDIEADYIAQLVYNCILLYSPSKIVIWGGVMHQTHLYARIQEKVLKNINGYMIHSALTPFGIKDYIVPPGLGENAGIIGAMLLGKREYDSLTKVM